MIHGLPTTYYISHSFFVYSPEVDIIRYSARLCCCWASPKRPILLPHLSLTSPRTYYRYGAFNFFVYIVTLPFRQADFGVVLEGGGILICIF
jgi:hypothetical protein